MTILTALLYHPCKAVIWFNEMALGNRQDRKKSIWIVKSGKKIPRKTNLQLLSAMGIQGEE